MAELAEHAALGIGEERPRGVADHDEGVVATHDARAQSAAGSGFVEIAVVAMGLLEVREVAPENGSTWRSPGPVA